MRVFVPFTISLALFALSPLTVFAQTPGVAVTTSGSSPFIVAPYLQFGNPSAKEASQHLTLVWHAPDDSTRWTVEIRRQNNWVPIAQPPAFQTVRLPTIEPHKVYTAELSDLIPNVPNSYRVLRDGISVFEATATPPKASGQKTRIVVFGDCGADTADQRAIAYQTYKAKPDYVFITGDIVYSRGRISEYRKNYFPIYNANTASATTGAPLIRSIPFLSSPGNHDILDPDFDKYPDAMAYFLYWRQPLNGPVTVVGSPQITPLKGSPENQKAFLSATGQTYPRMANFSFDYGDVHWTVLDANPYVDWNDAGLREWVRQDLKNARKAKWRFVGFHQPGFNSSEKHFSEQQMRVVADLFEEGKVDLVLNGHVHNYQRSFPLRFAVAPGQKSAGKPVAGTWTLDKAFDGKIKTKPSGVLYLVTGAGGADLYDPQQETKPETWQGFTEKFIASVHSLTQIDVDGKRLTVQQIAQDGKVLDTFILTK